jgi:hypothetical protein
MLPGLPLGANAHLFKKARGKIQQPAVAKLLAGHPEDGLRRSAFSRNQGVKHVE